VTKHKSVALFQNILFEEKLKRKAGASACIIFLSLSHFTLMEANCKERYRKHVSEETLENNEHPVRIGSTHCDSNLLLFNWKYI
jgi:hypothetical protein